MELTEYIIPIVSVAVLCAGWVVVQLLAKKLKTKNHFDNLNDGCGDCTCGGTEECENTN